ncbi:MAG: hypothetical protein ABIK23_06270 [candidate division WOR-3 bacterium]
MNQIGQRIKACSALLLLLALFCGKPQIVWQRFLDTGTDEQVVALLSQGGVLLLVGNQGDKEIDSCAGFLQWLDLKGNLLRRQRVAEGKLTILRGACLFQTSNIILCGYTRLRDTTVSLIFRLGPDGRTLWKKGLAMGSSSWANGVCLNDTNIAICGGVVTNTQTDILVCLLNPNGKTIWSRNYPFKEPAEAYKIASDQNGNIILLGSIGTDILLMKLKPDGETLWTRRYDSGANDRAGGLALDRFGNIVGVGTAGEEKSQRCVILEYAADGGAVRKVAYQENARAEGNDAFITEKGDIYVCGSIFTPKGKEVLAFQYIPNATSVWERQIPAGRDAVGKAIVVNKDVFIAAEVRNRTRDIALFCLAR